MRISIARAMALGLGLLAMAGCAAPRAIVGEPPHARISHDIAAFNEAYAEAANNLILWNVLRARDRLPRTYVAIKDITTAQGRSIDRSFGLDGLNLGGNFGADPWGVAGLGGSVSTSNEPSYGISPLVADDIGRAVLSPTPPRVFSLYWDSWGPRDILLAVLVNRAVQMPENALAVAQECLRGPHHANAATPLQEYVQPHGLSMRNAIDEPGETRGQAFLRFARWVKEHRDEARLHLVETYRCDQHMIVPYGGSSQLSAGDALAIAQAAAGETGRIGHRPGAIEVRPRASITTVLLEVQSGPHRGVWELELRSLDQAIFYLGESVRQPADGAAFDAWAASRSATDAYLTRPQPQAPQAFGRINMVAADCANESVDAPLFRVWRSGTPRNDPARAGGWQFDEVRPAARVHYRGAVYEAGQPSPINSSCAAPADFSGSVLTLLAQLLAANQSPEALQLPARFN